MEIDLLRYAATELDMADRRFTARAENSSHSERKAQWKTVMILTVFGSGCACLGALVAVAGMLRG